MKDTEAMALLEANRKIKAGDVDAAPKSPEISQTSPRCPDAPLHHRHRPSDSVVKDPYESFFDKWGDGQESSPASEQISDEQEVIVFHT